MATSNREYGAFYPSAMSSGLGMAAAAAASQDRVSRGVSRDLWKDKHGNRHGATESELRKSKSSHLSRGLGSEGSRQTPVSYGKFTGESVICFQGHGIQLDFAWCTISNLGLCLSRSLIS